MVTDDERREVAERLRDEVGCGSSWPGMERLGLILGIKREPRTGWEGRILTRLADLIEPSGSVKCVAEVKVDGEKLKKLVHDSVAEYVGVNREALLGLAEEMQGYADGAASADGYPYVNAGELWAFADHIREACGEVGE